MFHHHVKFGFFNASIHFITANSIINSATISVPIIVLRLDIVCIVREALYSEGFCISKKRNNDFSLLFGICLVSSARVEL